MKKRNLHYFLTGFLVCILIQNVIFAQTQMGEDNSELKNTDVIKSESELVHFGDIIDVNVLGSVDYDWRGTISQEGFLDDLTGIQNPVLALCRSEEEIADKIAVAYAAFLRNPKVSVKIIDKTKRPFSVVYGAVKTPQRFQISRPILLNELIVYSGGFTDDVSGEIQIFRPRDANCLKTLSESDETKKTEVKQQYIAASQEDATFIFEVKISDLLSGDKTANLQIYGGDIITVLEAKPIYITGGVENPKQISSRSEISLTRAISSAGGLSKKAVESDVTIFRRENNTTKVIKVDLSKIGKDESLDIMLKPFDIVDVKVKGGDDKDQPPILEIKRDKSGDIKKLPLRVID